MNHQLQFTRCPLSVAFIDGDAEFFRTRNVLKAEPFEQPLAQIFGQQFGGRLRQRQQDAILAWEDPAALFKGCCHLVVVCTDLNRRVHRRQEHAMIEFLGQDLQVVAQCDEVKDVMILVERTCGGGADAIVVPMQPFTDVAVERDEMRRTEDQLILLDGDVILRHGRFAWN